MDHCKLLLVALQLQLSSLNHNNRFANNVNDNENNNNNQNNNDNNNNDNNDDNFY